jgi:hypothetical protein
MAHTDRSPTTSYDLLQTDTDLAHLRRAVSMEAREVNPVFPLGYWRRRVRELVESQHLLPAQLAIACALIAEIDSAEALPLARAS